jgi:hypothetical protein
MRIPTKSGYRLPYRKRYVSVLATDSETVITSAFNREAALLLGENQKHVGTKVCNRNMTIVGEIIGIEVIREVSRRYIYAVLMCKVRYIDSKTGKPKTKQMPAGNLIRYREFAKALSAAAQRIRALDTLDRYYDEP